MIYMNQGGSDAKSLRSESQPSDSLCCDFAYDLTRLIVCSCDWRVGVLML